MMEGKNEIPIEIEDSVLENALERYREKRDRAFNVVSLGKKLFFVDEQLGEIRNIENPNDAESVSQEDIDCWKKNDMLKRCECQSGLHNGKSIDCSCKVHH